MAAVIDLVVSLIAYAVNHGIVPYDYESGTTTTRRPSHMRVARSKEMSVPPTLHTTRLWYLTSLLNGLMDSSFFCFLHSYV